MNSKAGTGTLYCVPNGALAFEMTTRQHISLLEFVMRIWRSCFTVKLWTASKHLSHAAKLYLLILALRSPTAVRKLHALSRVCY